MREIVVRVVLKDTGVSAFSDEVKMMLIEAIVNDNYCVGVLPNPADDPEIDIGDGEWYSGDYPPKVAPSTRPG